MMGRAHAVSGVLAAVTVAYSTNADVATGVLMIGTLPGFALLPDIDHAKATVSNTYGWLTRLFSYVLGHRRETHSVPGITALAFGVHLAVQYEQFVVSRVVLTVVLTLCWAAIIRLFKIPGFWDDIAPIPAAIAVVWFPETLAAVGIELDLSYLPPAVAFGMLIHVVGDVITKQGCPLFWPFSKRKTKLALFKAGSWFERWIMVPAMIVGTGFVGWEWLIP
jgi:membrane-bound metal-dependent hydrolase YbcI (DUF457 family)